MKHQGKVLVLLAVGIVACGGGSSSHTIRGALELAGRCPSTRVDEGDPVLLRDGANKTIGTGELAAGTDSSFLEGLSVKERRAFVGLAEESKTCVYKFRITDVPDAAFYSVEVGDTGKVTYPKAKLEKHDWKVGLTLS